MDDLPGHGFDSYADLEILMASLGLSGPELVGRDLHLSH